MAHQKVGTPRKHHYDEDGHYLGYRAIWHFWPRGEDGHNVDYYSEEKPRCPMCDCVLTQEEYIETLGGLPEDHLRITRYACEECQTLYYGPVREQDFIDDTPKPQTERNTHEEIAQKNRNTASVQSTSGLIASKYRYLLG